MLCSHQYYFYPFRKEDMRMLAGIVTLPSVLAGVSTSRHIFR